MIWQQIQSALLSATESSNLTLVVWVGMAAAVWCSLMFSFRKNLVVSIPFLHLFLSPVLAATTRRREDQISLDNHNSDWTRKRRANTEPGTLTDKHIKAIASRNWKEVLVWITFSPDELTWVDRKKQTALLYACLFQAPAHVIELILLQAPELANVANAEGEIPLHWAMRLGLSHQIVRMLLAANPSSGVMARDKDGNTPLLLLWEGHQDSILQAWWNGRDHLLASRTWDRIVFLFKCDWYQSVNHPDADNSCSHPILHMAARCPCPPALFPLILQVYREEMHQKDTEHHRGQTALAAACSNAVANRFGDVRTKIDMLLTEDDQAAVTSQTRDRQGRLPFHCALASGIVWDEGVKSLLSIVDSSSSLSSSSSSSSLLCDEMISQHDPVTGLAPFMLAAAGARQRHQMMAAASSSSSLLPNNHHDNRLWQYGGVTDTNDNDDNNRSLTTIYNLLRADPLQACCCRGNPKKIQFM